MHKFMIIHAALNKSNSEWKVFIMLSGEKFHWNFVKGVHHVTKYLSEHSKLRPDSSQGPIEKKLSQGNS